MEIEKPLILLIRVLICIYENLDDAASTTDGYQIPKATERNHLYYYMKSGSWDMILCSPYSNHRGPYL
ncbi:unnamed protein product [Brassica oleracea var. botrytis]